MALLTTALEPSIQYIQEGDSIKEIITFEGGKTETDYKIPERRADNPHIKHGAFKQFIHDILVCSGHYENNKMHGRWEYFQNGEFVAHEIYDHDVMIEQVAYFNGKIVLIQYFKNRIIVEKHLFDLNGELLEIIYFKDGKVSGHEWYKNNVIIKQEVYN